MGLVREWGSCLVLLLELGSGELSEQDSGRQSGPRMVPMWADLTEWQ